ncbi:MAG: ABC transporter ATP-binding protein [Planctomycetota bacterium]|jgi:putative ABC transport system ATP-binding protein|nr:ABC transporter ATP-binding protein [Planctomycetota bacterium]MDP6762806.1 ABC transporter ATP-binding protein [Planctomycetota bacterium]MDP6990480.1 ABC transporter ATP-binding protein [Planctomycetota bacterium]
MTTTIASAKEVYRFFDQGGERTPVLKGLSLEVAEGEFVCVMGPSGSGKSTLLHILSGLDRPDSGVVTLGGERLHELGERRRTLQRREQVGYVFQFFNLLANLSVLENVALPHAIGRRSAGEREDPSALLDSLGLAGREGAFPHELSGGEMQRVSIARALAGGQPLLLCDEPTGNLSQQAGREVMELLRGLCDERGRAVLLVTHNPRDATFADRVLFLVDGELAEGVELRGPGLGVEAVHEALAGLAI